MKLKLEIELGNDTMKCLYDAIDAIEVAFKKNAAYLEDMTTCAGLIKDRNGHTVGNFEVKS